MSKFKLSPTLVDLLKKTDVSDFVDVVLELNTNSESVHSNEIKSRSEKIAAKREAFDRYLASIEKEIRNLGGEITGRAWINQTIRARVPAQAVKDLSMNDKIEIVDLPRRIKSEAY
jgi:hypothetical protein